MDRTTCVIDAGSTSEVVRTLIELIAGTRNLETTSGTLPGSVLSPAVQHRMIQIEGFWPVVDYLIEIKPWPVILPDTPEERAAMRTLTELIILRPQELGGIRHLYLDRSTAFGALRLLDLAVAAYADVPDVADRHPWVHFVREGVDSAVSRLKEGVCA